MMHKLTDYMRLHGSEYHEIDCRVFYAGNCDCDRCECGELYGVAHECPVLPRMDTPDMMPLTPPESDDGRE